MMNVVLEKQKRLSELAGVHEKRYADSTSEGRLQEIIRTSPCSSLSKNQLVRLFLDTRRPLCSIPMWPWSPAIIPRLTWVLKRWPVILNGCRSSVMIWGSGSWGLAGTIESPGFWFRLRKPGSLLRALPQCFTLVCRCGWFMLPSIRKQEKSARRFPETPFAKEKISW